MKLGIQELSYALDSFYLLLCAALVLWMTAGFAVLEAGLVRVKNTAEILTKNIGLFVIACLMYLCCGYGLMFGQGNGWIPGFQLLQLNDHSYSQLTTSSAPGYSQMAYFFLQLVFVASAISIVSGAVAERMKLWSFFIFAAALAGVIYPIEAYWKWGGGWLERLGFVDYAGSGVVHLCGGAAALAGVLLLGPRQGKYRDDGSIVPIRGSNLPLAAIGTLILWFGWLGFNGSAELHASDVHSVNAVARIMVNTNLAGAAGLISSMVLSRLWFGKADITMTINGALGGLVAITADPLSPGLYVSCLIGAVAGVLVVVSIVVIERYLRIDDPVGAISDNVVASLFGLLVVPCSNPEASFVTQCLGAAAIFTWVFLTSLLIWALIRWAFGLRVSAEEEYVGSDLSACGMEAYPEFVLVRK